MKYSVVIITLNEQNYVYKLLNDLQDQTFKDFEVIVVDGNSSDDTVNVVKKYRDLLKLRVIESERRGPGLQRNIGANNSGCENIMFLDADSRISPNFISDIDKAYGEKDFDYMSLYFKSIEDKLIYRLMAQVYNFYIKLKEKKVGISAGAFIFIKKGVFDSTGGFDEKLVFAEDRDFTKRAFKKGFKFEFLRNPKVGVSFRRFEDGGILKTILKVIKGEFLQLLGKRFEKFESLHYTFGGF